MGWFGPSKDEVWRQLSQEIGAEFVEGGFWKGSKVQAHVGPWTVTLDMGTSDEDGESPATRLRAPYINPEGFLHDLPEEPLQRPGQVPGHARHRGGRP